MDPIEKLSEEFTKFPGIGPRQARRFAYYVLSQSKENHETLVTAMSVLRKDVAQCPTCFVYFTRRNNEPECRECRDTSRNKTTLLVVEKDIDLQTVEKSRVYDGYYFVLGGMVPLHDQTPSSKVRIQELVKRVRKMLESGLKEVVIALAATQEGDHTYSYIQAVLKQVAPDLSVSILGRGLSTGTEIEYADPNTLSQAFSNRK